MTTQNFYGPVEQVAGNDIHNYQAMRDQRARELYSRGKWHETQRDMVQREADSCRPAALYGPLGFVGVGLLMHYFPISVGYGLLAIVVAICADLRRMQIVNARRSVLQSKSRMHNAAIASINDELVRL